MAMMAQLQKMQADLVEAQEKLKEETVSATAGGVVTVTITGDQRCTGIEIAPDVIEDGDTEMLQDLILTAFNQALDKSREMAETRLGPLSAGLSDLGLGF
jgi:hypothetical protein